MNSPRAILTSSPNLILNQIADISNFSADLNNRLKYSDCFQTDSEDLNSDSVDGDINSIDHKSSFDNDEVMFIKKSHSPDRIPKIQYDKFKLKILSNYTSSSSFLISTVCFYIIFIFNIFNTK